MEGSEDRVALIVGGGTGIGYASAARLGRRGCRLVLAGRREHVLGQAAERLSSSLPGLAVTVVAGDAGVQSDAQRVVDATVERHGRIDVVVNCAGVYEPVDFLDLTPAAWQRTIGPTLDAQLFVAVAAARHMCDAGRGRIVPISSVSSPLSEPLSAHYSAAKAAVSSLVRSIAVDLSVHGIQANAVAPGWIHTEMVDEFLSGVSAESLARVNLLARVGQPDEVANVVEYLALDAPAYMTGTTVYVDGGQTAMALLP